MTNKKNDKAIDIADFDTGIASDKGFDLELTHPTNTNRKLGVFITVLGKHSAVFREHLRDQTNERNMREAAAERKGTTLPPITAEEYERQGIESLIVCTKGWFTGDKTNATFPYRGEALAFTVANLKRVYEEQIWVRGQVDAAFGDLENFIKG